MRAEDVGSRGRTSHAQSPLRSCVRGLHRALLTARALETGTCAKSRLRHQREGDVVDEYRNTVLQAEASGGHLSGFGVTK